MHQAEDIITNWSLQMLTVKEPHVQIIMNTEVQGRYLLHEREEKLARNYCRFITMWVDELSGV
jgi:hypothetical protein